MKVNKLRTKLLSQLQGSLSFLHEACTVKDLSSARPKIMNEFLFVQKSVQDSAHEMLPIIPLKQFEIEELVDSDDIEIAVNMNDFKQMWQFSQREITEIRNRLLILQHSISRNNQNISQLMHVAKNQMKQFKRTND